MRILSIRTNGSTLATASVNINGAFAIRGVKVMDSSKGPFVSLPGYKAGNGEFKDICFPCTKEARQQFDGAVMDAYQQALTQVQSQSQRSAPDPFRQKTQTQTM
ncbi:MAG: SpoVG family protein [Proteiniphilum sp.]|nr:SpoVG family protein [Proteiniphilum sp.]